jgi:hypothetical protein
MRFELFTCFEGSRFSVVGRLGYGLDGTTVRDSNPGRSKRLLSSPKRPGRLWGPPSLLYSAYLGPFPGVNLPGLEVTHSHLCRGEVKMSGAMPLWRGQGNFTVHSLEQIWPLL